MRARHVARNGLAVVAWLFVACIFIQIFLAGLGVFDGPEAFITHREFGYAFGWLVLVMVVLAIVGRTGRRLIGLTVLIAVLFTLQSVSSRSAPTTRRSPHFIPSTASCCCSSPSSLPANRWHCGRVRRKGSHERVEASRLVVPGRVQRPDRPVRRRRCDRRRLGRPGDHPRSVWSDARRARGAERDRLPRVRLHHADTRRGACVLRSTCHGDPAHPVSGRPSLGVVGNVEPAGWTLAVFGLYATFGLAPGTPPPPPMVSGPILGTLAVIVLLLDRQRSFARPGQRLA